MTLRLSTVTAPTLEPVTVAEVKTHLRISHAQDDAYLLDLIGIARRSIETLTQRTLITTIYDGFLDYFPASYEIELPKPPLVSVTSIKYTADGAAVQSTLSANIYTVDAKRIVGRVVLKENQIWPLTEEMPNAVEIRFTCGYGATSASVPPELRHAIKFLVAHWYSFRAPVAQVSSLVEVPKTLEYLVLPFRVYL